MSMTMSVSKPPLSSIRFHRLLLTGAAGNLGQVLRPRLKAYCDTLRLAHRSPLAGAGGQGNTSALAPGEEAVVADLADAGAVDRMVQGCDAVVHMGGVSTEQAWAPILAGNIVGMYHLYEAVRRHGVKRVVFASSNHVTGFYRQDQVISPQDPARPDGLYGLSKAFGEDLAQLYWDKFGVETVSLRIGSSFAEPIDRRMLATWMSFDDLERLVVAALTAPVVGHSIIYGVSDNDRVWWDNTPARHIGYRPQDSSERFRPAIEAANPTMPDGREPATILQGGKFVNVPDHGG